MTQIVAWLTGKVVAIAFAVIATIAVPVAIVETVRLEGVHIPLPIFGSVTLVAGAIDARDTAIADRDKALTARDTALKDLGTCHGNVSTLQSALNDQSDRIEKLSTDRDAWRARAEQAIADAQAGRTQLEARVAALQGKALDTKSCPAALLSFRDLINGGL